MARTFNIGDHVSVTNKSYEYGAKYVGKVGVVKSDRYKGRYGVELAGLRNNNSTSGYFWFDAQNLIPQKEYSILCSIDKKDVLIGDLKTGYSYVSAEEAERLRLLKEIAEKMQLPQHNAIVMPMTKTNEVEIEKVIFNDPATIVFWNDGTKTIVKCENEAFDEEKGLAMAISKKVLGNKGNYYNEFKRWLPEKEEVGVSLDEAIKRTTENFNKLANKSLKGE